MGDVLFVWTAAYQTCLMRASAYYACSAALLSGLYQLFDLCWIKHVLTVWPLTSINQHAKGLDKREMFGDQTPSNIIMRVSMGLTVRRKTAKNLAVRRKNERILAVSRKKN